MGTLVTPLQFSIVNPCIYRGAFPREINYAFLRSLQLRYMVSLTPEPVPETHSLRQFCAQEGIELVHIPCGPPGGGGDKKVKRKKQAVPLEYSAVERCLAFLRDADGASYIHCTNGELVTSLVIACLRKLSRWSTVSILNEFLAYNSSINVHERSFIEGFGQQSAKE